MLVIGVKIIEGVLPPLGILNVMMKKGIFMRKSANEIATEAELDERIRELQVSKFRRESQQRRGDYYYNIFLMILIGLLVISYFLWSTITDGQSQETIETLEEIRTFIIAVVTVTAFSRVLEDIKSYRRGDHF